MKHLLRFVGIILSVIISISSITLLPASAQANTFNLHIFMCGTELYSFPEIPSDSPASGTYGIPTSFTVRLPNATTYVIQFYAYHSVVINPIFNTSEMLTNTPAACSANLAPSYYQRLLQKCIDCNHSCLLCNILGYHHSDYNAFLNTLSASSIDLDSEKIMVVTASGVCEGSSPSSSSCSPVYGINENWTGRMVVADASYVHYCDTNPYAHFRSVMVHEIGHSYGTPDHYKDAVDPCPNCIWGTNKNIYAVYSNCMTCADCSSTIYNNRGLYNHTP